MRTLIFGRGWLGSEWVRRFPAAELSEGDIADRSAVVREIDRVRPDCIVNAAGKTGVPNVDALEGLPSPAYRSNLVGPVTLASVCRRYGIHMTHLGSGCIYSGDNGGSGYAEDDPPNFQGSLYSRTKAIAERILRDFDVLQLRIRMPFSFRPHPRNLLTKLLAFRRVVSLPNSVTVLEDAWPVADALIRREATGVYNLVNDGAEYHDEVLAAWRDGVDSSHGFELVEMDDLGLKAARSNCLLSTRKLHAEGLALPPFRETLPRLIDAYAAMCPTRPDS